MFIQDSERKEKKKKKKRLPAINLVLVFLDK